LFLLQLLNERLLETYQLKIKSYSSNYNDRSACFMSMNCIIDTRLLLPSKRYLLSDVNEKVFT